MTRGVEMSASQITVLPVDNGDSIMIEHDGCVVITDLNYRKDSQDDNDDCYDIGEDIRDACFDAHDEYACDVFVLTHPDKDHRGGFEDLFYVGDPSKWKSLKTELLVKELLVKELLVKELWVSEYMDDSSRSTDASKFLFDEVARRKKLSGGSDGDKDGNRIKILASDGEDTEGSLGDKSNLEWLLLAPTQEEADIESEDSSNDSSLVIRWNAKVDGSDNLVLLGGDSGVDIWERIWEDHENDTAPITWQFLVAPHHCSRSSMARKDVESGKYDYSDDALKALGEIDGNGFITSSSNKVVNAKPNPPSFEAKNKYLNILHKSKSDGEKRFFCTGSHKNGKPAPVVFKFTSGGITTKMVTSSAAVIGSNSLTSEASTYGQG
ncbi:MAG: hypothetical protein ACJATK_000895 [Paracoccaceae bacterium]|jgi:hypothetical protein